MQDQPSTGKTHALDHFISRLTGYAASWEMTSPQGQEAVQEFAEAELSAVPERAIWVLARQLGALVHPAMSRQRLVTGIVRALTVLQQVEDILSDPDAAEGR